MKLEAIPDEKFSARVTKVNKWGEAASAYWRGPGYARYAVELALSVGDERLRPGMSARVNVTVARRKGVVYLPPDAIREDGQSKWVLVAKGEKRERREITVGLEALDRTEITSGIKAGEQVEVPAGALRARRRSEFPEMF